jgi:hypothetical protein
MRTSAKRLFFEPLERRELLAVNLFADSTAEAAAAVALSAGTVPVVGNELAAVIPPASGTPLQSIGQGFGGGQVNPSAGTSLFDAVAKVQSVDHIVRSLSGIVGNVTLAGIQGDVQSLNMGLNSAINGASPGPGLLPFNIPATLGANIFIFPGASVAAEEIQGILAGVAGDIQSLQGSTINNPGPFVDSNLQILAGALGGVSLDTAVVANGIAANTAGGAMNTVPNSLLSGGSINFSPLTANKLLGVPLGVNQVGLTTIGPVAPVRSGATAAATGSSQTGIGTNTGIAANPNFSVSVPNPATLPVVFGGQLNLAANTFRVGLS